MAEFPLQIPDALLHQMRLFAEERHVSLEPFCVTAIAEKVAALKTPAYFRERQARGDLATFDAWLDTKPLAGDDAPD